MYANTFGRSEYSTPEYSGGFKLTVEPAVGFASTTGAGLDALR